MPSMSFVLTGQDHLSRVLDRAGDSAEGLRRRLTSTADDSRMRLAGFTRDADGRLRNLRGQFASTGSMAQVLRQQMDDLGRQLRRNGEDFGKHLMGSLKLLAPAILPVAGSVAASLVPVVAGAGTVAVAMGAMTAAIVPQVGALADAAEAQKKYEDAVAKSGARSQEAAQALNEAQRVMAALPPETRRAAAAFGVLKDSYTHWSDSLAGDTMAPVTKSLQLANALLPKTSTLVKNTARETDRFVTILGGTMASPGLDALNTKFTAFAEKTLRRVNDEIVHLLRVGDGGQVGGPAREFLDWARAQGPSVAATLRNVATALLHILDAASQTGVGMLQVVNVVARLVSAVPPGAIAAFLQLAIAIKAVKLAAAGLAAGRSAVAMFATQILAMNTAAAAAPGRLAAVRAGIGALSRTAKLAAAGTGIGLLVIALSALSERGEQAPPDVDKLTSSLKQLGDSGRVTGEAAKAFGRDLDGLYGKVRSLTDPTTTDRVQQFLVGWTGWDSTPVKDAKDNLGAVDRALASLVSSGQADLAAAAVKRLTAEYGKGGRDTSEFAGKLTEYKSALADAKFEQELAAQSMGLFGAQAQKTQTALAAQKQSADGLRQSIKALNDVQRQGLGGMIGFEASIDAAAKAARENRDALSMTHGQLNLNGEKARNAASALQDLASKTDEAAASARESGSSWSTISGIYERGRTAFIKSAQAMGLNRREAERLARQILKIPNKTTLLKGDVSDLDAKINKAQAAVDALRQKRKVAVGAEKDQLDRQIAAAQAKVDSLRQKRSVTLSAIDKASRTARSIQAAINAIRGKSVDIYTVRHTINVEATAARNAKNYRARGGPIRLAGGGSPPDPGGPVFGPGTSTSDSIPAMLSDGEYVVRASSVAKYGMAFLDAVNAGTYTARGDGAGAAAGQGLAAGLAGSLGLVQAAARKMAGGVTSGIKGELQIASPSKKTRALAYDTAHGFLEGLTSSRDKIKSVSADLVKDIKTAFSGRRESDLVKMVDRDTKKLLDAAAKRDKLAATIATAKKFASDVTSSAREGASLSGLGLEPEQVTAGSIKAGLAGKLAQIRQFTAYIDKLAKRGLSKGLLRQILNMGPEAGYAYASALVGADSATFKQINSLQSSLDKSTTSLGRLGADRLYDAGRNAGKGFLKGLEGQQKDIENLMLKIAKSMQKSIKKALGIRSPSTVMARLGEHSTAGLARGLVDAMPTLDRALDTVSGRVAGTRPVLGRPAVARTTAADRPIQVQIDVHGPVDPVATAREIRRVLLELKRVTGVNVNLGVA